jgi:hypothetical protein
VINIKLMNRPKIKRLQYQIEALLSEFQVMTLGEVGHETLRNDFINLTDSLMKVKDTLDIISLENRE